MKQLLVNIDHVATLRNARGEKVPDPVRAAMVAEEAGAAGIVFHLREDRRHIRDDDVYRLREAVRGLYDFEMAPTDEMIAFCCKLKADLATLVPESREELTTEGGLNMKKLEPDFRDRVIPPLKDAGVAISLFIDPNPADIELSARLGVEAVELHTGNYANARDPRKQKHELERLRLAAIKAHELGLRVNAGHGLDFDNIDLLLAEVPHLQDLSIGHALIADALFNGLENTVRRMADIIAG
ncbi:pyridoxine 5'-phosphate synthase [Balneolales bacterium ANBcel1]|nr:pyridoxine 5'-phosphate synthase [Balneolales bacterium ANBcel1]